MKLNLDSLTYDQSFQSTEVSGLVSGLLDPHPDGDHTLLYHQNQAGIRAGPDLSPPLLQHGELDKADDPSASYTAPWCRTHRTIDQVPLLSGQKYTHTQSDTLKNINMGTHAWICKVPFDFTRSTNPYTDSHMHY